MSDQNLENVVERSDSTEIQNQDNNAEGIVETNNLVGSQQDSNDSDNTTEEGSDKIEETEQIIDYHDQILEYLKSQECYPEVDLHVQEYEEEEMSNELFDEARNVLLELLADVENITSFKKAYAEKKQLNNQFDLFDLTKIIPSFHIDDRVMDKLAFREVLVISKVGENRHLEPVGGLCLNVQVAEGAKWDKPRKLTDFTQALMDACIDVKKTLVSNQEEATKKELDEYLMFLEEEMKKHQNKFLIHLSTQFDVDGRNAGSRQTSWVDRNLHTLEEKRTEYIRSSSEYEGLDEKLLYAFIGKEHYDVRVQPEENLCFKYCYSFRRAWGLIGEGANFILMRYLAIQRFIGEFELSCLHIEGGLCRNIYKCEGPTGGIINNEQMDLYKVYRIIIEECGAVQRSCTLLSLDGRIMKHDWEKCSYVLHLNPVTPPRKKMAQPILHLEETWKHDIQLFSQYLDKKLSASYNMKSYLHDHKEIGNLIRDYIQNILQIKPENIVQFTKHYFLNYAPYLLPRTGYFEQDINKCFYEEK